MEEAKVVLVMMDGRELKARVAQKDLELLTRGARIRVKAEPFGFYEEGILESFYFQPKAITAHLDEVIKEGGN